MRKLALLTKLYSTSLLFLALLPLTAIAEDSLNLSTCYKLALKQSELLKQREADVRMAEARYKEALSMVWPKIYSVTQQRARNDENFGRTRVVEDVDVATPGNNFSAQSKTPFDATINLRQPLFTGFREIYLARAQSDSIKASVLDRERQAELLYQDLADVYNQVVYYQRDLKILDLTEQALNQRVSELNDFIKLGRSRVSERDAAELELSQNSAIAAQVEGLLGASRELLGFLIGQPAETLKVDWQVQADEQLFLKLDSLVTQVEGRADVKASQLRVEQASKELVAAERESWPRLSLDSNYYLYEDPEQNRDWDVLLRMDIPLFVAGEIDARISQAEEQKRINQLERQRLGRVAEREIRTSHNNLLAARREKKAQEKAVQAAKKNFEAQKRDYELGVVNNLEVLAAIASYQRAARQLLEVEAREKTTLARLKVALGQVSK
jgi:outer membrane protein TolC